MTRLASLFLSLFLGLHLSLVAAPPRKLAIAAASDLQFALVDLKAAFAMTHPETELALSFGSSGNFYGQLNQGAPFDLFLSADLGYPKKLVEAGLAEGSTLFNYSRGHLVLWVPKGSPIPLELGLKALLHPMARKVAIANPRTAPYGKAAEAALRSQGLLESVQPRLVFGDNVAQTAQFVQSGAADIGIVALSLALAPAMQAAGRYVEVPLEAYPPLDQAGVIPKQAQNRADALAFRTFLLSAEGRAILQRYGFAAGTP